MKKKIMSRKLKLDKKTISDLNYVEMDNAVGGATFGCNTATNCNSGCNTYCMGFTCLTACIQCEP
jgi:hypothetical protein